MHVNTKCIFSFQGLSVRHVVRGGNRMQHPAGDRGLEALRGREPHTAGQPAGNAPEPDLQRERQPVAGEDQHHLQSLERIELGLGEAASEQRSQLHSLSVSLRAFLLPSCLFPAHPGDDGAVSTPGLFGGREAEVARSGAEVVPGEPVAEGWAVPGPAAATGAGTGSGYFRGAEQTPAVHEQHPQVRPWRAAYGKGSSWNIHVVNTFRFIG